MKKRWLFSLLFLFAIVFVLQGCGKAPSNPPTYNIILINQPTITEDATWTKGNVYIIDQTIVVEAALTIDPGTIIKLTTGSRIDISDMGGSIMAEGTSSSHIVFTSAADDSKGGDTDNSANPPQKGDWTAVQIFSVAGNSFVYCDFYYGGNGSADYDPMLWFSIDSSAVVDHCTFAHSAHAGLNVTNADPVTTQITNNTFFDNSKPLWMVPNFSIDDSNTFHKGTQANAYNGIWLPGSQTILEDQSWGETEVPFVSPGFLINDSVTLTLGSGVVLKFDGGRIDVGDLADISDGGATYTSYYDDSYCGNTDESSTSPGSNDWEGILNFDGSWRTGNIHYATHY